MRLNRKSSEKFAYIKNLLYLCSQIGKPRKKTPKSMSEEIRFDKRNYRKHSKKNKALIKKSLEELGAGRSVVIDREGELIAGNGVYEQAKALGMQVRVVETDGSELVVVKRTDLATEDEKRRKLALADNSASDTSEFADRLLAEDWTREALAEWGVQLPDTIDYGKISAEEVAAAIMYKPSAEAASVDEFVDDKLYNQVAAEVAKMEIPKELKEFVEMRMQNFRRIRFDKVADYYARADEKTRQLFRQLALVFDISGTTFERDILDFYSTGLDTDADAYEE